MDIQNEPQEEQKKSRGGKAFVIFLIIAATVASLYLYQANQAPEGPTAKQDQDAQSQRRAPDLPIFAPQPDGQPGPGEAPATAQAPADGTEQPRVSPSVTMQATAPRTDKVLTLDFIADLTNYLAAGYQPPATRNNTGSTGLTTVTFKKLNMRYGVELHGLRVEDDDPPRGRKQALDHLMSPITLRLAYSLFSDDLVTALAQAGQAQTRDFAVQGGFSPRTMSSAQVQSMLDVYASLTRDVGQTFKAFASRPDLVDLLDRYFRAVRQVNDAYTHYVDREAADAPDKELELLSLKIKTAINAREALRRELLRGTTPGKGSLLTEGDVLDIAAWVSRRLDADPEAINAVGALASLSQELADALLRHNSAQ